MKTLLVALAVAVAVSLVGGCAASSPIQRYSESESNFSTGPVLATHTVPDKDIYRIFHRASTGFTSIQSIRQAAERRALDFCERQGKGMLILGEETSGPPYILGNFPRIEIVFACIDKPATATPTGDARYQRIQELKKLLDDGALTQDEFDREKAKLLNAP